MEIITFVLDGSNLAALDKARGHCLETIESIRVALRKAYPGCRIVTLVDASLRHRVDRSQFDEQETKGILFSAPADEDADFFILSFARRRAAVVVTTDRYIGQAQRVGVPLLRPMLADGEVILGEPRVFRNVRGRRSEPFDLDDLASPQGSGSVEDSATVAAPAAKPTPAVAPDRAPPGGNSGADKRADRHGGRGRAGNARSRQPDRARAPAGQASGRSALPEVPLAPREQRGRRPTRAQEAPADPAAGPRQAAPRSWRDDVAPAVRKLRRAFGLKSPRGRARTEQGRSARARRYAWLQDVLHAARHAGLTDATRRELLLAGLPRAWWPYLPHRYAPSEQIAFDVCVLAHLPRAGEKSLLPLSIWLRNAHALAQPLRLAAFFLEAVEEQEKSGSMPLVWLPFPDSPYEGLDRAAYLLAQGHAARRPIEASGNDKADVPAPEPLEPDESAGISSPAPNDGDPAEGASAAGDGTVSPASEACPYCGGRALPLYDFYLGRSCVPCFVDREEAVQEKFEQEQAQRRRWPREPL